MNASTPVNGGRIIEPMLGEPLNLVSALSSDSGSHEIASRIFVSPLKYDKDLNIVPYAAKNFEVLNGGKIIKFDMRKNIRWFDGKPLTAEDVEFTYKLMIDPKTPTAYSGDFLAVKKFTLTGKYSFEVEYDKPFARSLITWCSDILPKHILEGVDLTKTDFGRHPVGAGPYKLKEWIPGRTVVLEANDDYFEGRPYIDELVFRIIPDSTTQFLELKSGNIDAMGLNAQQYSFQTKGKKWDDNYNKFKYLAFGYTFLGYNMKRELFKDVRVRRAITYAIDKKEIVKGVLFGLGEPAIGPYKPGTWVYNKKLKPYGFNPEKAKELLAEAGWKEYDSNGILVKNGKEFKFTILTNQGNSQRIKSATIIQNRLKNIGIKVEIRTVEWASFVKEFLDKGNFDAIILGWNILQDPDIFSVWHSSNAVPGKLNLTCYKNSELDKLLEEGRQTFDQQKRKKIYDQAQEILYNEQPYCFLFVPMSLPIYNKKIHGVEVAPAGVGYNYTKWWIPEEFQKKKSIQQ
nr:peptide-binding protein [Maridesulfovibrio bastinii]